MAVAAADMEVAATAQLVQPNRPSYTILRLQTPWNRQSVALPAALRLAAGHTPAWDFQPEIRMDSFERYHCHSTPDCHSTRYYHWNPDCQKSRYASV
jgi:hypothetical protein